MSKRRGTQHLRRHEGEHQGLDGLPCRSCGVTAPAGVERKIIGVFTNDVGDWYRLSDGSAVLVDPSTD